MRKVLCIAAAVFSVDLWDAWAGEGWGWERARCQGINSLSVRQGKFARRLGLTQDQAQKMKELRKARRGSGP